jgi:hypothetical protein
VVVAKHLGPSNEANGPFRSSVTHPSRLKADSIAGVAKNLGPSAEAKDTTTETLPEKFVAQQDKCFTKNRLEIPTITSVLYINLEESTDRREHMEKMLSTMGLPYHRLSAVAATKHHLRSAPLSIKKNKGQWLSHQKVAT